MNSLTAGTTEPAITDGIKGATGESGVLVWCNRSINILGLLNGATEWTVIGTLGSGNSSVSIYWEDYVGINFQSLTATSEKVRVFPRHSAVQVTAAGITTASEDYAIDKLGEFTDLPTPDGTDTGKFLSVTSGGSLDFISTEEGGSAIKEILTVEAVSTPQIVAGVEATLKITGKGFKPTTKIYMFSGPPTPTQILNYYNHTFEIMGNMLNDYNAVEHTSSDTTVETGKINVFYSGSDYGGLKPYGYENPTTMALRVAPSAAHLNNTYSIILVNADGRKSVLENCLTVSS